MKKWMAVMGLILASSAVAQKWDAYDGKLTLVGCYGKTEGVYCDYSFILLNKPTSLFGWYPYHFKIFKQDGTSQEAESVAFIDDKFGLKYDGSTKHEIISNVPVKVQVFFKVPNSTASFRAIVYNNIKFDNIPVRPYGKTTVVPSQLTSPVSIEGYSISLSDCKVQGAEYACSAKATPVK